MLSQAKIFDGAAAPPAGPPLTKGASRPKTVIKVCGRTSQTPSHPPIIGLDKNNPMTLTGNDSIAQNRRSSGVVCFAGKMKNVSRTSPQHHFVPLLTNNLLWQSVLLFLALLHTRRVVLRLFRWNLNCNPRQFL